LPIDVLWQCTEPEDLRLEMRLERCAADLLDATGKADRELSIVLTDDPGIRTLNLRWRGLDCPTDVLSFPMDEGEPVPGPEAGALEAGPLGDIVLSLDTARAQAPEHGYRLDEELTFLLIHGLCHLLGHDHAEPTQAARMRGEEDRLLAVVAAGQPRPPTPY
jgi:probable rRNA maturation factor